MRPAPPRWERMCECIYVVAEGGWAQERGGGTAESGYCKKKNTSCLISSHFSHSLETTNNSKRKLDNFDSEHKKGITNDIKIWIKHCTLHTCIKFLTISVQVQVKKWLPSTWAQLPDQTAAPPKAKAKTKGKPKKLVHYLCISLDSPAMATWGKKRDLLALPWTPEAREDLIYHFNGCLLNHMYGSV